MHVPRVFAADTAAKESTKQETAPEALKEFFSWFEFYQSRSKTKYAVTGANHVDEASYVKIGGIEQWVTIRGEDSGNPVLLVLHGGPGDVTNPWGYGYFFRWEKYFTVVQWDQRGGGRTLEKSGSLHPGPLVTPVCCALTDSGEALASTITIDRMVQDGLEVSEYLRQHLNKEKIILVGHSWGSLLGGLMAKARPELFYAFVGTGQVPANAMDSNVVAFRLASKWAQSAKNAEAMADLKRIGPPPYKEGTNGWALLYKWRNACEGPDRDTFLASTLYFALANPSFTVRDYNFAQEGQLVSGQGLFDAINKLDPKRLGGKFDLPVFVIQGAQDCSTPTELAKSWLDSISAPSKHWATIPGEGHFAVFIKSDEFLTHLLDDVRPLAAAKPR
jgi:pimeloyl-ACP methyl ester carboxylesterase